MIQRKMMSVMELRGWLEVKRDLIASKRLVIMDCLKRGSYREALVNLETLVAHQNEVETIQKVLTGEYPRKSME